MMIEAVKKSQQFIASHPNLSLTRIDLVSNDTVMITVNDIRVDFNEDGPFNLEMLNIYNDWVQITDPEAILHITGQLNASYTPKKSRLNEIIKRLGEKVSAHKRLSEVVSVAGRQYDSARRVNGDIYVYWPCLEVRISKDGIYYMDYTGPEADKFYEILQDEDAHSALRFGVHPYVQGV